MTREKLDTVCNAVREILKVEDETLDVEFGFDYEPDGSVDSIVVTLVWPQGKREFDVDVWGDGPLWTAKDLLKAIDNKM